MCSPTLPLLLRRSMEKFYPMLLNFLLPTSPADVSSPGEANHFVKKVPQRKNILSTTISHSGPGITSHHDVLSHTSAHTPFMPPLSVFGVI